MSNIFIVAKREFTSRAFKKKFLLITFFTPLLIVLFSGAVSFVMSYRNDSTIKVLVSDPGNFISDSLKKWNNIDLNVVRQDIRQYDENKYGNYDGILFLPPTANTIDSSYVVQYHTSKTADLDTELALKSMVQEHVKNQRLAVLGIDKTIIQKIDQRIQFEQFTQQGNVDQGNKIAAAVGGIIGFFLYLLLTINGSMIMRSVMEEKTNRIIEVMISTVDPRDLMFGKIIGVGMVGLFQVIIWCITTPLLLSGLSLFFLGDMASSGGLSTIPSGGLPPEANEMMSSILSQLAAINWMVIIPLIFVFFFLGYLMYASLFAAIGSAMGDDQGEGQSLTMLIIMPLLFGFYISMSAIRAPDSTLAMWSSIIPLLSPIVMPVRLAFSPPTWQILLSISLLILTSLFFAWLSVRIYRIGILMYGKKASLKEIAKWIRLK